MRNNLFKALIYSSVVTILVLIVILFLNNILIFDNNPIYVFLIVVFILNVFLVFLYFNYMHKNSSITGSQNEHEIQALKTVEKYRREFFGNVSHELKTPIFNIQGYVETLIDGALYDKLVNKKYLKRASKSIDRLMYIIRDLESITQLESEELKLELTEWNLKDLINEIIEQFEIKANKKKISFIHAQESTDLVVVADKGKMVQVLSNLISNSIKYGKKNGITKIRCHQDKNECVVSIKDNGIGIAKKNINRLFERFYRVDKSRSRDQGGTGLGLAIVKHIIEAHNQTINVKSNIDKGTEFIFSINCNEI